MPATHNVAGMVAQRQALSAWLRDLPATTWSGDVRILVDRLCRLYVRAADRDVPVVVPDDRHDAADVLDRIGAATELTFSESADDRWDLPRDEFRAEGGTTEMGVEGLMASLYLTAGELGELTGVPVAIPDDARDAAVAAVVWRASGLIEAPVHIVLDDGSDYVVGAGDPEAVLETDHEAVLAVAAGHADPRELAAAGRWRFKGPDEAREAFERTFRFHPT
jgi:hypothetical protein